MQLFLLGFILYPQFLTFLLNHSLLHLNHIWLFLLELLLNRLLQLINRFILFKSIQLLLLNVLELLVPGCQYKSEFICSD